METSSATSLAFVVNLSVSTAVINKRTLFSKDFIEEFSFSQLSNNQCQWASDNQR